MRGLISLGLALAATCASAQNWQLLPQPSDSQWQWLRASDASTHRFAMGLALDFDSRRDGSWHAEGDERVWQLDLLAEHAQSLTLQFQPLHWPEGSRLSLFNAAGEGFHYDARDIVDAQLWSESLSGDRLRLQWRVPRGETAVLRLPMAYYGARDPYPKHGNCNVDVSCANNEDAQNQIDSTVLLLYRLGQNLSACSGLLVNNQRQDGTPYILTADHCGIEPGNQNSVRVYWQFQDPGCGNAPGHNERSPNQLYSIAGVEVLADGNFSDFTLLVVGSADNPAVLDERYRPYWSGFNVGSNPPLSGFGVHHPQGDEKSISRFRQPAFAVRETIDGRATDAWQVFWDSGTTEQGSSGSGLWNQNRQVVGLLSGGSASCQAQDAPDFYGRLDVAWEEGGSCRDQLRFWLDPDASGVNALGGRGLTATPQPQVPQCADNNGGGGGEGGSGGGSGGLSSWLLWLLLLGGCHKCITRTR